MNRKSLEAVITDALQPDRWAKKKDHWYLENDELIGVINLQKSDFGGQFYINLGAFIRPLIHSKRGFPYESLRERQEYIKQYYDYSTQFPLGKYPKENHCDIRVRLDRLLPDRGTLEIALDLENSSLTDRQRAIIVSQAIKNSAEPLFSQVGDLKSLRTYFRENDVNKNPFWMIPLKVKGFIDGVATPPESPWKPKPGQVVF